MLINALSYGTIIPLLYPYASQFGITPVTLSALFASFSLAQFLATPVIGRLSDAYGRRPALLLSILGTSISLALFASAQSIWQLFVSRILDGITGGNNAVAQAVIADTIEGPERAKAFGMLGAAFGVGFLLGPAIGGLLSEWHLSAPFWFASALALGATVFGYFFLNESLPKAERKPPKLKMIDFGSLLDALKHPVLGGIFVMSFVMMLASNSFYIGFQAYTVDVLALSPKSIGILFAASGLVNIFVQMVGIKYLTKKVASKSLLLIGLSILSGIVLVIMSFASSLWMFTAVVALYMLTHGPLLPLVTGYISEHTGRQNQGEMLGVNQSYISLGQIGGPLIAGVVAAYSVPLIFVVGAVIFWLAAGVGVVACKRAA